MNSKAIFFLRQIKNFPPQTHRDAKHEEKKPYNCAHCEESFAQKRKLYVHVQAIHTGKNEFACEQCDASYTEYRKLSDLIKELNSDRNGIFLSLIKS